jgi:hypothetical protein
MTISPLSKGCCGRKFGGSGIKADILRSHPEVVSVLVHVEPDMPEHRKQDGHHGFND